MEKTKCALCDSEETGGMVWIHDDENGRYYVCGKCADNINNYYDYLYFRSLLRFKLLNDAGKNEQ